MRNRDELMLTGEFSVAAIIRASSAAVRRSWPTLLLVIVVCCWAPNAADAFFPLPHLGWNSHNAGLWGIETVRTIATLLASWLGSATVVQIVLGRRSDNRSLFKALAGSLRSYPTLLPFWTITTAPEWWSAMLRWQVINHPVSWMTDEKLEWLFYPTLILSLLGLPFTALIGLLVPVVVAEHRGFLHSLQRCWRMMSRSRWKFLALFVTIYIATEPIYFLRRLADSVTTSPLRAFEPHPGLIVWLITDLLIWMVNGIWWVVIAVSYVELRGDRYGAEQNHVSDVFA